MRFVLPLILCACLVACSAPEPKMHATETVSADGQRLRSYPPVHMRLEAAAHELQISMGKLVFLGDAGSQFIMADSLRVAFEDPDGHANAELKAGTLLYDPQAAHMEFGAGVLWDVESVGQLEADRVEWDMARPLFVGTGGVRLFGPKAVIEGKLIETDIFMNAYRIDGVQGVYKYGQP